MTIFPTVNQGLGMPQLIISIKYRYIYMYVYDVYCVYIYIYINIYTPLIHKLDAFPQQLSIFQDPTLYLTSQDPTSPNFSKKKLGYPVTLRWAKKKSGGK